MLTASDLRWMEWQRRRAALRRMTESEDSALEELQGVLDLSAAEGRCAHTRRNQTLTERLGCPG